MLGCMGFYLIVLYLMRTIAAPPGARPACRFRPNCDDFGDTTLHVVGGRWNQHPTLFLRRRRARRFYLVHTFPARQPIPFAGGQASIGWLEMAGALGAWCFGMLACTSGSEGIGVAVDMLEYVVALIVCASSLYFLSVLLATFLDDQWRMWIMLMASGRYGCFAVLFVYPPL